MRDQDQRYRNTRERDPIESPIDDRHICPFMGPDFNPCMESSCALWVEGAYTTEGIYDDSGMCGMKFNAIKNLEGKIPV